MQNFIKKMLMYLPGTLSSDSLLALDRAIHRHTYTKCLTGSDLEKEEYSTHWDKQDSKWNDYSPPMRPSEQELGIYKKLIQEHKGKDLCRILILGSTPELRDLAADYTDAEVFVFDSSFSMIVGMLAETKNVDARTEQWIRSNWLNPPFPDRYFDLILGDVVLHQVGPRNERVFLERMYALLKEEGNFITRLFCLNERFLSQDFNTTMDSISDGKGSEAEMRLLLRLYALWLGADTANRSYDKKWSSKRFTEWRLRKKERNVLTQVQKTLENDIDSQKNWSPPHEVVMFDLLGSIFDIKRSSNRASDYPCTELFPMVSLSKKDHIH